VAAHVGHHAIVPGTEIVDEVSGVGGRDEVLVGMCHERTSARATRARMHVRRHVARVSNETTSSSKGGLGSPGVAREEPMDYRRPAIGKMRSLMSKDRRLPATKKPERRACIEVLLRA
jgi:hypothetical protein